MKTRINDNKMNICKLFYLFILFTLNLILNKRVRVILSNYERQKLKLRKNKMDRGKLVFFFGQRGKLVWFSLLTRRLVFFPHLLLAFHDRLLTWDRMRQWGSRTSLCLMRREMREGTTFFLLIPTLTLCGTPLGWYSRIKNSTKLERYDSEFCAIGLAATFFILLRLAP